MRKSILGLAALAGWMGVAAAEPVAVPAEFEFSPLAVVAPVADGFATANPVSEKDLGGVAGGTDIEDAQLNTAVNTTTANNNTVSGNVKTGQIGNTTIENVSGFSTIMLNTGNNVVMQSTTQVNIILK
jgi:hypothetical protein